MKISGILRTETKNKEIFEKRVPVKLDKANRYITAKVDGKMLKFFLSPSTRIDKPIRYAINDPIPLDVKNFHGYYGNSNITKTTVRERIPNLDEKYLVVTIK